jgi:phosphoribosylanthranilate isomerase
MSSYKVDGYLLDAFVADLHGGSGEICDWNLVRRAEEHGPIILAGGLTPVNVAEAIRQAEPYGVDVCSGVEESKGKKDLEKIKAFIHEARSV